MKRTTPKCSTKLIMAAILFVVLICPAQSTRNIINNPLSIANDGHGGMGRPPRRSSITPPAPDANEPIPIGVFSAGKIHG